MTENSSSSGIVFILTQSDFLGELVSTSCCSSPSHPNNPFAECPACRLVSRVPLNQSIDKRKTGKCEWIGEISRGINSLSGLGTLQLPQMGREGGGEVRPLRQNAESKLAVCAPRDMMKPHLCVCV